MIETRNPLDPITLCKMSNMTLRARCVVEGTLSGLHKSPHKGSSIEFLEHKEYSPGDEIKHLDWKALARSDKYYLKQFENETNLKCYILLDTSGSMGYKSTGVSKLDYAATLAASLTYLMLNQSDAVGLATFSNEILSYVPPRIKPSHLNVVIEVLKHVKAEGKSDLGNVLNAIAEKVKMRSLIIVISDFFDDIMRIIKALKHLHFHKNEIILFHLLDPYELEFPFDNPTLFVSMEDERRILSEPRAIRERYISGINRFIELLRQKCLEDQIDHWLINTSSSLDHAILKYLILRESILCYRSSARSF
ncbi:MAG TPA: DUF58 domain-containing protein [Candidatus Brocadiales bacterium]|nr:DUF58 domain-containing protein [Candidatus Brocadiales bacterium]